MSPAPDIRPVNRAVTKSEFAYAELRDLILSGQLRPGERLSLRPLANQLGISVMPVRDAIRLLENEGLVVMSDHQGARVAEISRDEILNCISVRMWLEVHAVIESAKRRDEQALAHARSALSAGTAALADDNGMAFTEANREFHVAIERSADALTASLIKDLWDRLWQVRRQSSLFVLVPDRMDKAQQEHESIFAAVEAGRVEAASFAAQLHRDNTMQAWEAALPPVETAS
jgi:DNA-binding GntR family transcriptional regulator